MKPILILSLVVMVVLTIFSRLPRLLLHVFKAPVNPGATPLDKGVRKGPFYRSNRGLGLLLRANPFPQELGIDLKGIYLIKRPWHGFTRQKFFYPLSMVKLVNITEYFEKVARVHIMIDHSGQNIELSMNRFYPVADAREFHRLWAETFNALGY